MKTPTRTDSRTGDHPTHARRTDLIGYLRAPADWSKGEVYMLTGITAGTTWLVFTHLLHAPTGVAVMLTGITALLAFAKFRQRHLLRHTLTEQQQQGQEKDRDKLADGLYEPDAGSTADAPATVPDPHRQP